MLQTLSLLDKATYSMVAGIYSFIAKVYDVMLDLSGRGSEAGSIQNFYLGNMVTAMYTLAGVFMLFRVTVSAVNMIINPDMVSDRNAGAGKILTRIVTSLIMLIMFWPSGIIFGETGILIRLENALLAPDGLVNKLIPENISSASESESSQEGLLVDNVYAASKIDCYYLYKVKSNKAITTGVSKEDSAMLDNGRSGVDVDKDYVHMTIYKGKNTSNNWTNKHRICLKKSWLNKLSDCDKYYLEFEDNKEKYFAPPSGFGFSMSANYYSKFTPNKCPRLITASKTGFHQLHEYYQAGKGTKWTNVKNYGWLGGWSSADKLYGYINSAKAAVYGTDENKVKNTKEKAPNTVDPDESRTAAVSGKESYSYDPLADLENYEDAVGFAQMAMGTFMSCASDDEECETIKAGALVTNGESIVDAMDSNRMHLDFLPAIVAGIGILIWVVYLCVEVIIRRFKLMLLQMIAPIPVISYSDPNDKMFGEWSKMYAATYADLFLKLIAIGFGTSLLSMLWAMQADMDNLIKKFFYIVAILVFAKMIPTMISKIFGISSMGGSFKDVMGMGKSALGVGAGAAIGAAVGASSGSGINRLTSAVRGGLRGAGSGSRGNVLGGANSIKKDNMAINKANALGSTRGGRMRSRMDSFFTGQDEYTRALSDIEKSEAALMPAKQALQKHKNVTSSVAALEKEIDKMAGYGVYDDALRNDPTKKGVWDNLVKSRNAQSALTQMESNMDQYLRSSGYVDYTDSAAMRNVLKSNGIDTSEMTDTAVKDQLDYMGYKDLSSVTSAMRSQMIADKKAEVGKLKFDSDQEIRDYVFNKLATDESFDGKGVTRELYNSVHESLGDAGYTDVKNYLGDNGLKNVNGAELNKQLAQERSIGSKEAEIKRAKEELDVSDAKASHDYVNRNG